MNPTGEHAESFEQANQPTLCANNCGFFANPACNNLCSKCYRDLTAEAERGKANQAAAVAAMQATQQQQPQKAGVAGVQQLSQSAVSTPPRDATPDATASPNGFPLPAVFSEPRPASPGVSAPSGAAAAVDAAVSPATAALPSSASDAPDERPVQKNTSRCWTCKKKIGLTGFKCRCGYVFCGAHRYAEEHSCDFDHKALGRELLTKNNPLVQADKITKF